MSHSIPIHRQLSSRLKKQFRDSFFTLKYFHKTLKTLSKLLALNIPKDTFIDYLPVGYFIEIETQKTISKIFSLFEEMENKVFQKIQPFINEDDKQKIIKKYNEEKLARSKKRRILMNYGNGDYEKVESSTLDVYLLKEAMDLLKSVLSLQMYQKGSDSNISSISQKNQVSDDLEESSGSEEREEHISNIQNLKLIDEKGKGLDHE